MAKTSSVLSPDLESFTLLPYDVLEGEAVKLEYIPISEVIRWDDNPKLHDIGAIISSIKEYGFRDPPTFDSKLAALVEGNGRCEALNVMMSQGDDLPRGILKNKDTQEWCMPILFGVDAKSKAIATRYAIDHNNLVMSGGDFTLYDISRMWDRDKYIQVLQDMGDIGQMPMTIDFDDLASLVNSTVFNGDTNGTAGDTTTPTPLDKGLGGDTTNDFEDKDDVVVYTVTCHNVNIAQDVEEAIQQLLDDNPGWDTEMKRRGAKPNDAY